MEIRLCIKKLHEVINKLVTYDNVKKVVVYTNGRIVPKGENLECLRHKKVMLDITNYGIHSSAHEKVIELAKKKIFPLQLLDVQLGKIVGE